MRICETQLIFVALLLGGIVIKPKDNLDVWNWYDIIKEVRTRVSMLGNKTYARYPFACVPASYPNYNHYF